MEMKSQMMKFLEEHNILSNKHFGFRKEHSTEQMLLSVLQNWRSELDKPESVYIGALSLDVRKAFDTVNHELLIDKLRASNFSERSASLLTSYLTNRSQIMKVGDANSIPLPITCGVPQGSILGPVLFNIAINDILLEFQSSFAYADDTLLYCTANSINKVIDLSQRLLIDDGIF